MIHVGEIHRRRRFICTLVLPSLTGFTVDLQAFDFVQDVGENTRVGVF